MKKLILFLFAISAFALSSRSQNATNTETPQTSNKKCCFKLSSLSLDMGSNSYRTFSRDDKGFGMGDPKNDDNKTNHGNSSFMMGMGSNNGNSNSRKVINFEIGLNPYSKKLGDYNKKRELVIGLFYSGSDLVNRNTTKFAYTPGDTFSFNSVAYQTDTVSRMHHINRVEANVLGINVKYLFKTDPEKRFSLFTGVGISAAYAITARVFESYTKDSAVVLGLYGAEPNYNEFDKGTFLGSNEIVSHERAKPTIFANVFMPFGINFRLCKNKEVLNQMNLFIEGTLGLQTQIVVNGETHFDPYMGCALGFRFNFK